MLIIASVHACFWYVSVDAYFSYVQAWTLEQAGNKLSVIAETMDNYLLSIGNLTNELVKEAIFPLMPLTVGRFETISTYL